MELRHRHPADTATAVDSTTAADDGRATRDAPEAYRRGPRDGDARQGVADTRRGTADSAEQGVGTRSRPGDAPAAGDDRRRYDADVEFKRGAPRPPGYLPDDTGRLSPRSGAPGRPIEPHYDERAPREMPRRSEVREVRESDAASIVVDHPAIHDPFDEDSPDRYGNPLTGPDGSRVPCFNGPPGREQASQGVIEDCGIIATLGSVAAYRPDDIAQRVREEPDATYHVTLCEARRTEAGAVPTGRNIEMTVTPELPISNADPSVSAAAPVEGGAAWCPVLEKALAGVDQTWPTQRRVTWLDGWASICAKDRADNADIQHSGTAPDGYVRLNQGSDAWDRAEVLTQLTGQEAEVRKFPSGEDEWRINRVIRAQLEDGKPVLVNSRAKTHRGERMPHNLSAEHAYEVTAVERGKVVLRNPWGFEHPQPMETDEFARNMGRFYTTLT